MDKLLEFTLNTIIQLQDSIDLEFYNWKRMDTNQGKLFEDFVQTETYLNIIFDKEVLQKLIRLYKLEDNGATCNEIT